MTEGCLEGVERGGADVEDGAEFGDEVAVDGFFDRACDTFDRGSAVGAAASELGEREAAGEGAGGAGIRAEEKRLAWKIDQSSPTPSRIMGALDDLRLT